MGQKPSSRLVIKGIWKMRKFGLLGTSALRSALFIGAAAMATVPAAAQDTTDNPATLDSEVELQSGEDVGDTGDQAIVVTGSRIRRPNLESTVPITSIGGEQLLQGGDTNIGDTLNELPQLRSTFAQQNPGLGIGIAGLNLLDLRGLGTQRTLVLVNGRRHVPADILNNAVSVDTNTIPNDLIERVDIVTGGNSAIYGSDAIAGVVNFVLRRDYEGLQIRGQAGVTEEGFGGNQYVSAMFGRNFAEDRGNITLHGEYSRQERIFASDNPWFRQNNGFGVVDVDPAGLAENSDGFPDRVFVRDIRGTTINFRGLVPVVQPVDDPATARDESLCGRGTTANVGGPNNDGTPFNCTFVFTPDGRLVPQTGTRFGSGQFGSILGGNGQTGREGQLLSIIPFTERYNFNLLAHYEFSEAAEVFLEAKANRVNALGNNAGPSFIQGTLGSFDFRERVRLDNPFLNPTDRATLSGLILDSGFNAVLSGRTPLTAADRAAIADGSYRFVVARTLADVGLRDEKFKRDTYRIVGGLRGTFNDDWSYEVSANYGKFEEDITTDGFIDRQRFVLAIDAGRNPATGEIQCRSQFDPTAALPIQRTDAVSLAIADRNAARLAADIAACVPYNPFGSPDNRASVDYFARTFTATSSLDQLVFSGFVSGDSSQLFELPGGPVSFAIGAEYREENAFYQQDPFVTDGFTNGVSIPSFEPDTFKVKEAFGEVRIPILRDMPFFEELTLSGAGRVAGYQGAVGTVYSYNAGVDYAPIRDVRFRANYSRAVRAPNVSETAFPLVPNFAPGFNDPCQPNQIAAGTATRAANCAADLGALLGGLTDVNRSLPVLSGSNPNLQEETSDSFTVGAVVQPQFLPGFSLSVDYYDIKVDGIIVSLGAQTIANSCYDQPTLDNVFCEQFTRFRGPGTGPNGELPGQILGNTLIQAPLNFASRERSGIDVNLTYRRDFGPVELNTNLIYTHVLKVSDFQDPINPDFENRILGEVGDPQDEFRLDVDLSYNEFTFGYRMRFIGEQTVATYEATNGLQDRAPENSDFSDIEEVPIITYSDLRFEWNLGDRTGIANDLRFYVGVDNVFDRRPPLGITATGAGPGAVGNAGVYDVRGRAFYSGFRARF